MVFRTGVLLTRRYRMPADDSLKVFCGSYHSSGAQGNRVASLQHSAEHLNGAKPHSDMKGCPSSINLH